MPTTDPPPKAKRPLRGTQAQARTPKKTASTNKPPDETEPSTAAETVDIEAETKVDTPKSAPPATPESDGTEAPAAPLNPFSYNESTLTLSLSFLPLAEGATGRQVIVSVHSKNGKGKSVLPEFIAPLQEGDLRLPKPVLSLLERYRTVTLPQRQAEAEAKASALAAKRPLAQKKGKDVRPEHVTAGTTKRVRPAGIATQFKLALNKK